jgi:uncharacterized protein involved in exopolysaccharide biosynthesis
MTSVKAAPVTRVVREDHPDTNIVVTIDRGMLDTALARQGTVTDMLTALSRYWWLWMLTILVAAGLGYYIAATQPELYRAEAVLFPPPREAGLAQFPSRLLGFNFGSGSPTTEEALATLTSAQFLSGFIEEHMLLPALFPTRWDVAKQDWLPDVVQPTVLRGVARLKADLDIETSVATQVVNMTYWHEDAEVAASIVNNLIADLNAIMRERAIARSRAIIDQYYLQLRSDTLTDVRAHILTLITEEMKILVSARGNEDFAFRTIDPATTPEDISYPNKPLIFALACVGGLLIGVLLSLLLHFYQSTTRGS